MLDELKEEGIVNKVGGAFQAREVDPETHGGADDRRQAVGKLAHAP
jgi:hypothetical protein